MAHVKQLLIGLFLGSVITLMPILVLTPARELSNDLASCWEYFRGQIPAYSDGFVRIRFNRESTIIQFAIISTVSFGSFLLLRKALYKQALVVFCVVFILNTPFMLGRELSVWYPIGEISTPIVSLIGTFVVLYSAVAVGGILYAAKERRVVLVGWAGNLPAVFLFAFCYVLTFPQMDASADMQRVSSTGFETMSNLSRALAAYYEERKEFPKTGSIEELPRYLNSYLPQILSDRERGYRKAPSELTVVDAWGNKMRYIEYSENGSRYLLGSSGSDGIWEFDDLRKYPHGYALEDSRKDIVLGPDGFIQWPGGIID